MTDLTKRVKRRTNATYRGRRIVVAVVLIGLVLA